MVPAINSNIAVLFDTKKMRLLFLSFLIGGLILALIITWLMQTLDREEAQMRRLTESILETEGNLSLLTKLHKDPVYRSTSLFWSTYSKSLLMAEKNDHIIQLTIAKGLLHTQGWEFIRLVENIEPYVMGYTPQQISAYQRLILDFKDPALEFDRGFVVLWKTCIDSFANRYEGFSGRILYYRDVLRWKDGALCPGLKKKAQEIWTTTQSAKQT